MSIQDITGDAVRREELAKEAYAAYGKSTGNKNFQGQPMPKWENLPRPIQNAWVSAAVAVARGLISPPAPLGQVA